MAENFLERVEKNRDNRQHNRPQEDVFQELSPASPSGYLGDGAMLPNGADADEVDYVFTNEGEITNRGRNPIHRVSSA